MNIANKNTKQLKLGNDTNFLRATLSVLLASLLVLCFMCSCSGSAAYESNGDGQTDSVVNIVIFSDFQCRDCETLHLEVEKELLTRYVDNGLAQLDFRVLGVFGPESVLAASAAMSAGEQGHFWEYRDALLASWHLKGRPAYERDELIKVAGDIGLDVDAFTKGLDNQTHLEQIDDNLDIAAAQGLELLPAVIINGIVIEGENPLETYVQAVEKSFSQKNNDHIKGAGCLIFPPTLKTGD